MRYNLDLIQAYKVPVRKSGNTLAVMVKHLKYKKDEQLYVLSEQMIKELIRANKGIDTDIVKALNKISEKIRGGSLR